MCSPLRRQYSVSGSTEQRTAQHGLSVRVYLWAPTCRHLRLLVGFIVLVGGLLYGAYLIHIPHTWALWGHWSSSGSGSCPQLSRTKRRDPPAEARHGPGRIGDHAGAPSCPLIFLPNVGEVARRAGGGSDARDAPLVCSASLRQTPPHVGGGNEATGSEVTGSKVTRVRVEFDRGRLRLYSARQCGEYQKSDCRLPASFASGAMSTSQASPALGQRARPRQQTHGRRSGAGMFEVQPRQRSASSRESMSSNLRPLTFPSTSVGCGTLRGSQMLFEAMHPIGNDVDDADMRQGNSCMARGLQFAARRHRTAAAKPSAIRRAPSSSGLA